MREIKFRAWDKNTSTIVDIKTIDIEPDGSVGCVVDYSDINLDVSECRLMQSTGLKDKNGIEIYEGDIVRSNWYDYDNNAYKKKGEVIFVGAQFVIAYDSKFVLETGEIEYDAHSLSYAENPEVIGNIYENSELLDKNL